MTERSEGTNSADRQERPLDRKFGKPVFDVPCDGERAAAITMRTCAVAGQRRPEPVFQTEPHLYMPEARMLAQ